MEEEDTRRFQRDKGRFGVRTNKTLKYNGSEAWTRRKENLDSIVVFTEDDSVSESQSGRRLVGISLNARKNWEIIENKDINSLKSSQDDLDVNYGPRIVIVEDKDDRNRASKREGYSNQLYGSSHSDEDKKEPEPELINGTNRKGFFVKEKRRKGKKGVLKPNVQGTRNRSKSFNNKSDESDSDSDSAIDEPEKDNRLIIASVRPKSPNYVRHKGYKGCGCTLCTGKNSKVAARREIIRNMNDL